MRFINILLITSILLLPVHAHSSPTWTPQLPAIGSKVLPTQSFTPIELVGINHDVSKPLEFQFFVNPGDKSLPPNLLKDQTERLLHYFLAALTIPEKDMWVNLSPYESSRIVPDTFGLTLMGRDLLAQDYLLKQLSASLTDPQQEPGKTYWSNVNRGRFNASKTPTLIQKVWIVPDQASVIEQIHGAFIVDAHLKVMTERDYLASKTGTVTQTTVEEEQFKKIIIPAIEKEVNEGALFASLRQMHHALLLAGWFKKNGMGNTFANAYVNQQKIQGITSKGLGVNDVYQQYVASFKKGVYNFINEDVDPLTGKVLARKYFSGGTVLNSDYTPIDPTSTAAEKILNQRSGVRVNVRLSQVKLDDNAMITQDKRPSALAKTLKRVEWTFRLATQGAFAGWRAARSVSIDPQVSLPDRFDDPNVPYTETLPVSSRILNKPDGVYQSITDGDKVPMVIDLENSAGSYVATLDRDANGQPYYFINFNEFAIHALGYNRPEVFKAFFNNMYEVVNRTAYSDFLTSAYANYIHMMMSIRPKGLDHIFIVNTGAEAAENAIKAVTLKRPDTKFMIAFDHAFHGRTTGAMSITSKPIAVKGFLTFNWPKVDFPDAREESQHRSLSQVWSLLMTGDPQSKDAFPQPVMFEKVMAALDGLSNKYQGAELERRIVLLRESMGISLEKSKFAGGVMVEPYQGEGGMNFTTAKYFQKLRYLTFLFDVPLIFDEVQSGFFVTGKPWAHDHFNLKIAPDIVTFSKKAQMGGMFMNDRYFVNESGRLNSTWGGSEAGIIRAVTYEDIIRREGLLKRINQLGQYALSQLKIMAHDINQVYPNTVIDARGLGLVLALNFPTKEIRDKVADKAFRQGLLVNAAGTNTIRILPRFDTKTYTIDEAFNILRSAILNVAKDNAMAIESTPKGGIDFATGAPAQTAVSASPAMATQQLSGYIPQIISVENGINAAIFVKKVGISK